jgi:hypothetical protein
VYLELAALSLHQKDGTVLGFVTESEPDVSQNQRASTEGEKFHPLSAQRAQPSGVDSELNSLLVDRRTLASVPGTGSIWDIRGKIGGQFQSRLPNELPLPRALDSLL